MYYGRACGSCILPVLNKIATVQAPPTTNTTARTEMPMVNLHTYPNAAIHHYISNMILKIIADTMVQPKTHKVTQ